MRANPLSLPDGTYVSVASAVRPDKGGRTAVLLMRASALADAGARSVIATIADVPEQDDFRDQLVARGSLSPAVEVVNIFTDLRDRDPATFGSGSGSPTAPPKGLVMTEETRADGTPYQQVWRRPDDPATAEPAVVDHLRSDGSLFLRWSSYAGTTIELVDHDGRAVRRFSYRGPFVRWWLRRLVGDGDGFVITDSRRLLPMLFGLPSPRMHLVAAFHNPHVEREGRWDGSLKGPYAPALERLADLDGLVLLTERQRDEIALRCGRTDNLFVVPNPVAPPTLPDPLPPRDPKRLVVVGRLEAQKRVGHALKAVSLALRTDPDLRLDVYGDGAGRHRLEKQAHDLGIAHAVTFHGYDPGARDRTLTAGAFLVTSRHEGYPLATLEAMSRGCPVISYDIKFGPREQIDDGVDGFLVADSDVAAFADRILALTSDRDRSSAMSRAAFAKAAEHTPQRFAEDWAGVFRTVKAQDARRVHLTAAALHRTGLRDGSFSGHLLLRAGRRRLDPHELTVSLDVIGEETGDVISFPVSVRPVALGSWRGRARLAARVDDARVASTLGDQPVRSRVMVVWRNAAWQSPIEVVSPVRDGRLRLGRSDDRPD
ncbi:glycosyltransferase [Mumia sp. zg.B21]|uniref:glycosyltransferase n=1 Tax=Mumia sp. zg.B21 TaxID=2855447 RepID=UPI001C6E97D4|nr:glycosyltransferase [Mumia sp. zg.B21]MBW9209500.1 glycosyltransferase [Mumia sp. zg.B21]